MEHRWWPINLMCDFEGEWLHLSYFTIALTSACPYVRGRTCKKNKLSNRMPETTTTQAVPSLSHARTCVVVRAKHKTLKKTFKPRSGNNNHTGRSFALACPYVRGRTCKKTQNFQTTTQAVPSLS